MLIFKTHGLCKRKNDWNFSSTVWKDRATSTLYSVKISTLYLLSLWSYSKNAHGHLILKWTLVVVTRDVRDQVFLVPVPVRSRWFLFPLVLVPILVLLIFQGPGSDPVKFYFWSRSRSSPVKFYFLVLVPVPPTLYFLVPVPADTEFFHRFFRVGSRKIHKYSFLVWFNRQMSLFLVISPEFSLIDMIYNIVR